MAKYFFTEANGQRRLIDEQELRKLAKIGVVRPDTPLETDTGHKGVAGQIRGLQFNTADTPTIARMIADIPSPQVSWLLDFAFRDLRLHAINLWACRVIYVVCCIAAILWGFFATFMFLSIAFGQYGDVTAIVFGIPLAWLGVALFILAARLFCEWYIIVFDWIVETTKAARLYIENNKKEGRN